MQTTEDAGILEYTEKILKRFNAEGAEDTKDAEGSNKKP